MARMSAGHASLIHNLCNRKSEKVTCFHRELCDTVLSENFITYILKGVSEKDHNKSSSLTFLQQNADRVLHPIFVTVSRIITKHTSQISLGYLLFLRQIHKFLITYIHNLTRKVVLPSVTEECMDVSRCKNIHIKLEPQSHQ